MYTSILVPLDGSELAECVLPHVESIARGCATQKVVLVSVTERIPVTRTFRDPRTSVGWRQLDMTVGTGTDAVPDASMPLGLPQETGDVGRMYKQAQRYLDRIRKQLVKKGINGETVVLLGNPPDQIASYAEKNDIDLIVMASHGRSGVSRWAYGSVADKVFRASCVPVLMVRAPGCLPGF
jgi:nucleotide-binding universal stress UspA family protein